MLVERIEAKWIDAFASVFEMCSIEPPQTAAILSESQSRSVNVNLAELALDRLGTPAIHIVVPTPRQTAPVPVRSTGASDAIAGSTAVIAALAAVDFVVDCTVEGLLHASELPQVLSEGTRVLMVSNEHPEALERLVPTPDLEPKVKTGIKKLVAASEMRVTSNAGTDLVRERRRSSLRRRLGLHGTSRQHQSLARRALPRVPQSRNGQRHHRHGPRRYEPHVQALHRVAGDVAHRR